MSSNKFLDIFHRHGGNAMFIVLQIFGGGSNSDCDVTAIDGTNPNLMDGENGSKTKE